ncbi:MAG TPA: hypothetical protein VIL55_07075 [Naasia sp.]
MKRLRAFFAVAAVLVLAACSGGSGTISAAASQTLQSAILTVSESIAAGDTAAALGALESVRDLADNELSRGQLSEKRHSEIVSAIDALKAELEDKGAPTPTPGAPLPSPGKSSAPSTGGNSEAPEEEEPAEEPTEEEPPPSQAPAPAPAPSGGTGTPSAAPSTAPSTAPSVAPSVAPSTTPGNGDEDGEGEGDGDGEAPVTSEGTSNGPVTP